MTDDFVRKVMFKQGSLILASAFDELTDRHQLCINGAVCGAHLRVNGLPTDGNYAGKLGTTIMLRHTPEGTCGPHGGVKTYKPNWQFNNAVNAGLPNWNLPKEDTDCTTVPRIPVMRYRDATREQFHLVLSQTMTSGVYTRCNEQILIDITRGVNDAVKNLCNAANHPSRAERHGLHIFDLSEMSPRDVAQNNGRMWGDHPVSR
jgi:hypothetical protein